MFLFLDFKTSKTLVIGSFYYLVLLSLFDISATDCWFFDPGSNERQQE